MKNAQVAQPVVARIVMVVGGEWFAMWQSKLWNGQEAAFRFYLTLLGILAFVNQEDPELHSTP